jgi:predicted lipid carrier protein YhbT
MTDATTDFFEAIAGRHEPLLERTTGTMRVELVDGDETDSWVISIAHGDIEVVHGSADADCTLRTGRDLFERLATGQANAMAGVLRGAIVIEGDTELLVRVQRLFPGPREQAAALVGSAVQQAE